MAAEFILLGQTVFVTLDDRLARAINAKAGEHNTARAGDIFPAVIVRRWSDEDRPLVNVQIAYDGDGVLWATSLSWGTEPGQWCHPHERVSGVVRT